MKTVAAPPALWVDWCAVTGTSPTLRDEETLSKFATQAHPSHAVLKALQPAVTTRTPAWPSALREDSGALHQLLRVGTALTLNASTPWSNRLRIRRLLFAAVLLAPEAQGGFNLTRAQIRALTPARIEQRLPGLESTEDQMKCISCAVWAWLDVLGANSDWSRGGIRQVIHRQSLRTNCSRHPGSAPNDAWKDWPNYANLMPAIDRWGWVDPYSSMHPSSLSKLIKDLERLYDEPLRPDEEPPPSPPASIPKISPKKEAEILARADEVNARVTALLQEYS